jgi:hypothetical protein
MAVTNENVSGTTPSTWSSAVDQAAAGNMIADEEGNEERKANGLPPLERPRRLIVVSGGNIVPEIDATRIRDQDDFPIEDPAQAWNALTIGGYTDLIDIHEKGYEDWMPSARAGELSPHSRTSAVWTQGVAPIKPELVMEAGNRAFNPKKTEILTLGSLSLLTTGKDPGRAPLVPFEATSAATAQAARIAAQLQAAHPEYWPETIRALMVHSAEWTAPMWDQLESTPSKRMRYKMARRFGYGVPGFERALASASNHLALLAQAEIQPFKNQQGRKFNLCHYYHIPIPRDLLEKLENKIIEMKVTLSYFIEPNPGRAANVDPQRYQSYGLRFDHQRPHETVAGFKQRVNPLERDDPQRKPQPEAVDPRWTLGEDSISAGSLHCDVWKGPAIELSNRDTLCVKPINGWWRDRASLDICTRKARYALIITVKAPADIDIYTPIRTNIGLPVPTEIEI